MLKTSVAVECAVVPLRRIARRRRAASRPPNSRAHTCATDPAPRRRASASRRANISSIAAPYSRRNASGDRRSSQRYIRMLRLAADRACAVVPPVRARPGARLPGPRRAVQSSSMRSTCVADRHRQVLPPGQAVLRPSGDAAPGTAHRSSDRGVRRIALRRPVRSRIHGTARGRARGGHGTPDRAKPEQDQFPSRPGWTTLAARRLPDGKL